MFCDSLWVAMLTTITSQPFFVSLLILIASLFFLYTILGLFQIKPLNRFLIFIPLLLVLSVVYMQNGPLISTLLLSTGFLASFVLAFTLLAGPKK